MLKGINYKGWNPIHSACEQGHCSLLKLMLKHANPGAVNIPNGDLHLRPLHSACIGGHKSVVKVLLHRRARVDARDKRGQRPLHYACKLGYPDIVELLVQSGSSALVPDAGLVTPLHRACQSACPEVVEMLLTQVPQDVDVTDHCARSPLHYACNVKQTSQSDQLNFQSRSAQIVGILLNHGADVLASEENGLTPLHCACAWGVKAIVEVLIEHGADVAEPDHEGRSPLHHAALEGHVAVVELLLGRHPANIDALVEDVDQTALMLASKAGHLDVVRCLLRHGASLTQGDSEGMTALHHACAEGCTATVQLLIEAGADPKHTDDKGITGLHHAIKSLDVINALLDQGLDVNLLDAHGATPLHHAAARGRDDVVKALLDRGADPAVRDSRGMTALHMARRGAGYGVADMLSQRMAQHSGVESPVSVEEGEMRACNATAYMLRHMLKGMPAGKTLGRKHEYRLAHGMGMKIQAAFLSSQIADMDCVDAEGMTTLHQACAYGHRDAVEMLLTHGARMEVMDHSAMTPLHHACISGYPAILELLLQHLRDRFQPVPHQQAIVQLLISSHLATRVPPLSDVDADEGDTAIKGLPALHYAASQGFINIVRLLLLKPLAIDINEQDEYGMTALMHACMHGHADIVTLLLAVKTIDVNLCDEDSVSPLLRAASHGHTQIAAALLSRGAHVNPAAGMQPPLLPACNHGHKAIVELLLKHGAVVTAADQLRIATMVDTFPYDAAQTNATMLHAACREGHVKIAEVLIQSGLDVNAPDAQGLTPLHHACARNRDDVIKLLQRHGAVVSEDLRAHMEEHAKQEQVEHNPLELLLKPDTTPSQVMAVLAQILRS